MIALLTLALAAPVADFTAPNAADGKPWSLAADARDARAVVVVFLGTECPVNNAYLPTLAGLAREYGRRGVVFVGVNPNRQDDAAAVARHAREYGVPFPVLKDAGTAVADALRAARVPEAFVLDAGRTVRYRGRIDDQFDRGVKRPAAGNRYLADALDAVLAGRDVAVPVTEAVGCPINRPKPKAAPAALTYAKHVAPVVRKHCQGCHRPGEIGPFALMTAGDAAAWAGSVREAVESGRMPPWHADAKPGTFANDRRLSAADRRTLLDWIEQGCEEGDPADLPPARPFVTGWQSGTPDEVIAMNATLHVPAAAPKGGMPYRYVLAGGPFPEDRWVRAAEVRPGNRGVVHHVIVHVLKPGRLPPGHAAELGEKEFERLLADDTKQLGDQIVSYVPGDGPLDLPAGYAKKVAKGSQLVFELHYTPNGKAGTDRSVIGLVYAKERPRHEVKGEFAINTDFRIPAGAPDYRVRAAFTADRDLMVLSLNPHMHLRGKAFEYRLDHPDGRREVLLSVPRYDFNWQTTYTLAEPKLVPKGAKVRCVAKYDNSAGNANNPDPTRAVTWGDQTWDEMMIGYFEYFEAVPATRR